MATLENSETEQKWNTAGFLKYWRNWVSMEKKKKKRGKYPLENLKEDGGQAHNCPSTLNTTDSILHSHPLARCRDQQTWVMLSRVCPSFVSRAALQGAHLFNFKIRVGMFSPSRYRISFNDYSYPPTMLDLLVEQPAVRSLELRPSSCMVNVHWLLCKRWQLWILMLT